MNGIPAIYLGKIVDKQHFRAFVYGPNGEKKLVESWDAFEASMQSGIWFATIEDAGLSKAIIGKLDEIESEAKAKPKPKAKLKSRGKPEKVEEVDDSDSMLPDNDSVFEVTNES